MSHAIRSLLGVHWPPVSNLRCAIWFENKILFYSAYCRLLYMPLLTSPYFFRIGERIMTHRMEKHPDLVVSTNSYQSRIRQ